MYSWDDAAYLMHHGIKGQKWGIRRFQNEDGTLTPAGVERYGRGRENYSRKEWKQVRKDIYNSKKDYQEKFKKRNAKEIDRLKSNMERKAELYNKAKNENSMWREHGELGEMIYQNNTKRSANTAAKAANDYANYMKKGDEYVERKLRQDYGRDYDDWLKDNKTRASIVGGAVAAATFLAYYGAFSAIYS